MSLLLHVALLMIGMLHAEDKPNAEPGTKNNEQANHTVFVPFDETKPPQSQTAQRYFLDRADFERLWALAKESRKPAPVIDPDDGKVEGSVLSALYKASIEEQSLRIEARFEISTRGVWAPVDVKMLNTAANNSAVPITEVLVDDKPVALEDGKLRIEKPGAHRASVRYALPFGKGWSSASLQLPQTSASMMLMELPTSEGVPEFADQSLLVSEQNRTATIALGSTTKLDFRRKPARPLVAAPPPTAQLETVVELNDDRRITATVLATFHFPGSARRELELALDPEWDINEVFLWSGDWRKDIRLRRSDANGKQTLHLTTLRDIEESGRITVVMHPRATPKRTPLITPLAGRYENVAGLAATSGIEITPAPTATQPRLANKKWSVSKVDTEAMLYRLGKGETLAFDAKPVASKTEARTDYVVQLSEQKMEVFTAITLKRQRGAWQQLRVDLPEKGFEVQAVNGTNVTTWEQVGDQVFLRFGANTGAETRIVVYAATTRTQVSSDWVVKPMKIEGIEKVKGTAIIAAHSAVETRLATDKPLLNAREIDSSALDAVFTITPPIAKQRALEFESAEWSAAVSLKEQPVRFAADGVLLAQATGNGLLVSQQVALGVEQGALKHVIIRLPKSLPEATVKGDVLREARHSIVGEFHEYDCTFQSQGGLQGHTSLTFDMHLPLTDAELAMPFVEVVDASRLRRWFVLDNASDREMTIPKSDGVETSTKDTLPYLPEQLARPRFYTARNSGGLSVKFTQLQTSAGNAAIITLADIQTVLRADGERWDTVVYSVQNRALQFLPVVLPDGAELIAVSVSGEAVRADESPRDGKRVRLIPMIQTRPGQTSMEVRLVYRIKASSFAKALHLDDPEVIGISAERTIWTVTVPKGWRVDDRFTTLFGNMEMISKEGHEVERLNKMLSDFQTMNRYLGSNAANLSEADSKRVVEEAKKLGSEIQVMQQLVLTENRIAQPVFSTRKASTGKSVQSQVDEELGNVSKEWGRQNELLKTNTYSGRTTVNAGTVVLSGSNTWASNNLTLNGSIRANTTGQSLVGFNDNVGVNSTFFDRKVVALNAANTFTGAVTINGGTLTTGGMGGVGGASTSATAIGGNLTANNSRAFNGAGNLQLNPGSVDLNAPQVAPMGGSYGQRPLMTSRATAVPNADPFAKADEPQNLNYNARGRLSKSSGPPDSVDGFITATPSSQQLPKNSRADAYQEKVLEELKQEASLAQKKLGVLPAAPADPFAPASPSLGRLAERETLDLASKGAKPGSPSPLPALASPSSPADIKAKPMAGTVIDLTLAPETQEFEGFISKGKWTAQPGAIRAYDAVGSSFKSDEALYTTQAVNQLRPTGRRSLAVGVPSAGEVFHFRKLKDHAVLDLNLKHEWSTTKIAHAKTFGTGIGLWALVAFFIARRAKRNPRLAR